MSPVDASATAIAIIASLRSIFAFSLFLIYCKYSTLNELIRDNGTLNAVLIVLIAASYSRAWRQLVQFEVYGSSGFIYPVTVWLKKFEKIIFWYREVHRLLLQLPYILLLKQSQLWQQSWVLEPGQNRFVYGGLPRYAFDDEPHANSGWGRLINELHVHQLVLFPITCVRFVAGCSCKAAFILDSAPWQVYQLVCLFYLAIFLHP